MKTRTVEYTYLKNYTNELSLTGKKELPATCAIAWCMMATHVYRIFTKYDMYEFLYRMAISLHSLKPTENWYKHEYFFNYKVNGETYQLNLLDLVMHFGMETFDYYDNSLSRENYIDNVDLFLNLAIFLGGIEKINVVEKSFGGLAGVLTGETSTTAVTPEMKSQASLFAFDVLMYIPERFFTSRSRPLLKKERTLVKRRERMELMKAFDINKIPSYIIRQCLLIIYDNNEEQTNMIMEEPKDFAVYGEPLIHIAWLWANGFIETDGTKAWMPESNSVGYKDYMRKDGRENLLKTIRNNRIEETVHLLKGQLI